MTKTLPDFRKGELIADYPAWAIYRAKPSAPSDSGEGVASFRADEIIGLPWETRSHGTQYHWYRFGSAASSALEYNDCPIASYEREKSRGHPTHWLNAEASMLTREAREKEERLALDWGDKVIFEGRIFRIEKAPNQNAALVEVERVEA